MQFTMPLTIPDRANSRTWLLAFVIAAIAMAMPVDPVRAQATGAGNTVPGNDAGSGLDADELYELLAGELAMRAGDLPLAAASYLRAARSTRDATVAERAVRIAVFARENELALEGAQLWNELDPDNEGALETRATLLLRSGRIDDAVAGFERLIERTNTLAKEREEGARQVDVKPAEGEAGTPASSAPGSKEGGEQTATVNPYVGIAEILSRERDKKQALEVMERLAAKVPEDAEAQGALGQMLARAGELDRAAEVFKRLIALAPDKALKNEQAVIFYARILQERGDVDEALTALDAALKRNPQSVAVRMTYARLLVDAERESEAIEEFRRISEDDPKNLDARYALGLLLLQAERYDESREQFEVLTRNMERRETAWFYIGQIAESQERIEDAIAAYRKVDEQPNRMNAKVRIAVLLGEQGKVDEARAELHGLHAANPREAVRLYRAEAEILTRAEDEAGALAVYDRALAEHPVDTDLLYSRALLAERLDRIDEVERDLRDILSREPSNADVLNALGYTLADRTERYEEAHDLIKQALALKPDDHYVIDSMGWVLFRLGRHDEAIEHLRRAMSVQPDPEIAAHLGEVLWVAGQHEEAKKVLNAALEDAPDDERLIELKKRFQP